MVFIIVPVVVVLVGWWPFAFHNHMIYHCQFMSKCPLRSEILADLFISVGWPTSTDVILKFLSFWVVSCLSFNDINVCIYVIVLIASMLNFISSVSLSLFSTWFCFERQYAIYIGLELVCRVCTLCIDIPKSLHCSHCLPYCSWI